MYDVYGMDSLITYADVKVDGNKKKVQFIAPYVDILGNVEMTAAHKDSGHYT